MKNRLKSYSFWTALSGAVVVFINALGEMFGFSIADDVVSGVIMGFAGILIVFGVVTMPPKEKKSKDNFKGDKNLITNQQEKTGKQQEEKLNQEKISIIDKKNNVNNDKDKK